MADLQPSRLAEGKPPIARTAVGYARNRTKKMRGALFNCLTTRAVYLDLSPTLNFTDVLLILRFLGFTIGQHSCTKTMEPTLSERNAFFTKPFSSYTKALH